MAAASQKDQASAYDGQPRIGVALLGQLASVRKHVERAQEELAGAEEAILGIEVDLLTGTADEPAAILQKVRELLDHLQAGHAAAREALREARNS